MQVRDRDLAAAAKGLFVGGMQLESSQYMQQVPLEPGSAPVKQHILCYA